jgi:hypothetical protein
VCVYILACIPVARQRPRKKQLYNSRYWVTATATEEWCFLCSPCRYVISRTVGARSCERVGKEMSTEADDIVGIRHQATTGDYIADCEDFVCAVVTVICEVCRTARA